MIVTWSRARLTLVSCSNASAVHVISALSRVRHSHLPIDNYFTHWPSLAQPFGHKFWRMNANFVRHPHKICAHDPAKFCSSFMNFCPLVLPCGIMQKCMLSFRCIGTCRSLSWSCDDHVTLVGGGFVLRYMQTVRDEACDIVWYWQLVMAAWL